MTDHVQIQRLQPASTNIDWTQMSKQDRQKIMDQRLCGNNARAMAKLEELRKRGLINK